MTKSSTLPSSSKQLGKARMGRPPSKEVYAAYVLQTRNLMTAIKAGAGKLSNRKIEEGLGFGKDETGAYSGRYFARYLNTPKAKNKAALPPDRLSQIAEKALQLGWLSQDIQQGLISTPHPFKHLEVPDGQLLSERIQHVKTERLLLLKAQNDAVDALRHLAETMKSCKQLGLMHAMTDYVEGEAMDVMFDGIDLDINKVIGKITAAFVFNEEFIGSESLFS